MATEHLRTLNLTKGWHLRIRSAVLNVISLAKYSLTVAHSQAWNRQGSLKAPEDESIPSLPAVICRERLGGLLKHYERRAA